MTNVLIERHFLTGQECEALNDWVTLGVKNKWLDVGMSRSSEWAYQNRLTTRKRIMWMFGYQISKAEFLQLKERHEQNDLATTD